ncbi:MAG: hypothetical protein B7Z27_01075 [Sphingobacteriia bacterium 32-37-4]|nr:MAG: hypothetical protein B7Z27_01075 [Sphingobacteriia bacterium 32-37-4]
MAPSFLGAKNVKEIRNAKENQSNDQQKNPIFLHKKHIEKPEKGKGEHQGPNGHIRIVGTALN